jgi:hypothetical protein
MPSVIEEAIKTIKEVTRELEEANTAAKASGWDEEKESLGSFIFAQSKHLKELRIAVASYSKGGVAKDNMVGFSAEETTWIKRLEKLVSNETPTPPKRISRGQMDLVLKIWRELKSQLGNLLKPPPSCRFAESGERLDLIWNTDLYRFAIEVYSNDKLGWVFLDRTVSPMDSMGDCQIDSLPQIAFNKLKMLLGCNRTSFQWEERT